VVVLEAAHYPREKVCAGAIGARGLTRLARLGVNIECPKVVIDAIALRLAGETLMVREPGLGVVVRRVQFDHELARTALARGIDVRDGCEVAALRVGDSAVEIDTPSGTLTARAVVGADGVAGIVRRAAGFPRGALRAQVVEVDTEAVADDLARDTLVFDLAARDLAGYAWDFPTLVDERPLMCRGAYVLHPLGGDSARARTECHLAARGLRLADYRVKQFAERGFEPGEPIARPRVLLVGEAAGIDIATGEGIAQAIEYGALAGHFLTRALDRDDLGFAGWTDRVSRAHLGLQLRARHVGYRLFYGRRRELIERALPKISALLGIGVADFAGTRIAPLAVLRGAWQALAVMVHENARDA
jgi:flavin-dependent dehydrogenase